MVPEAANVQFAVKTVEPEFVALTNPPSNCEAHVAGKLVIVNPVALLVPLIIMLKNNVFPICLYLATEVVGVPLNPVYPIVPLKSVHATSVRCATVYPVALVKVPLEGVPNAGVVNVKLVADNPDGNVVDNDGTPLPSVTRTELLAVASADMTFAADAYNKVLMAFVLGYVVVV